MQRGDVVSVGRRFGIVVSVHDKLDENDLWPSTCFVLVGTEKQFFWCSDLEKEQKR